MAIYRDPFIGRLIDKFNAEGPAKFKNRYFYGDPVQVPKSQLPAVFITRDSTAISDSATGEIESTQKFVINVVMDLTRDFNQAFDNIGSANTVYDAIEGRNTDGTLRADSLAYILTKYRELGTEAFLNLGTALELDYGVGIEKRGPGVFTVEGVIRCEIRHQQLRPQ